MKITVITRLVLGTAIFLTAAGGAPASSERLGYDVSPFVGWSMGGRFTSFEGAVNVVDSECFGLLGDFPLGPSHPLKGEVLWSHQRSTLTLKDFPFHGTRRICDVALDYYNVGAAYEHGTHLVRPYYGLTLGALYAAASNGATGGELFFDATLAAGAKAYLTRNVGLRLDARAMLPMTLSEVNVVFHPGAGTPNLNVSASVIPQLNVNLGVMVAW